MHGCSWAEVVRRIKAKSQNVATPPLRNVVPSGTERYFSLLFDEFMTSAPMTMTNSGMRYKYDAESRSLFCA